MKPYHLKIFVAVALIELLVAAHVHDCRLLDSCPYATYGLWIGALATTGLGVAAMLHIAGRDQ